MLCDNAIIWVETVVFYFFFIFNCKYCDTAIHCQVVWCMRRSVWESARERESLFLQHTVCMGAWMCIKSVIPVGDEIIS